MPSDYVSDPTTTLMIQLLPLMVFQIFYAVLVFQLCAKQKWNAWLWTIVTLIPLVGMFAGPIIFISSHMRTIDRLNQLECRVSQ